MPTWMRGVLFFVFCLFVCFEWEFFKSWTDVEFCKMPFLCLLRWSCGFCLLFCYCGIWCWLICIYGTILTTLDWIQFDCDVWSFFFFFLYCWTWFTNILLSVFASFIFFCFLGLQVWHMEVPRLGVELELQLLATARATARQDLSHVYDLCHSSQQCQILNPLSEVRDRTCILMDASWVSNLLSHNRNSQFLALYSSKILAYNFLFFFVVSLSGFVIRVMMASQH